MTSALVRHVDEAGHGRLALFLEGGYDLEAIEESVYAMGSALGGEAYELGAQPVSYGLERLVDDDAAFAAGTVFAAGAAFAAGTTCAVAGVRRGVEALAVAGAVAAAVVAGLDPSADELTLAHAERDAPAIDWLELSMLAVSELEDDVGEVLAGSDVDLVALELDFDVAILAVVRALELGPALVGAAVAVVVAMTCALLVAELLHPIRNLLAALFGVDVARASPVYQLANRATHLIAARRLGVLALLGEALLERFPGNHCAIFLVAVVR